MIEFLKNNWIWLTVAIVVIALVLIILLIVLRRQNKPVKKPLIEVKQNEWFEALGGSDNLLEANAVGSRLSIKLQDKSLLNKEKIKELGVENILEMSGKIILVVENNAEHILKELQKNSAN